MKALHKRLGVVLITDQCLKMQETNPDPTSMYVEKDGEIIEVTKSLVKRECCCSVCHFKWYEGQDGDHNCAQLLRDLCIIFAKVINKINDHPPFCKKYYSSFEQDTCTCGLDNAKLEAKDFPC